MGEKFVNSRVDRTYSGFGDMTNFFKTRSGGSYGAMLGAHDDFVLPTPIFIDTLGSGLAAKDAAPLKFLFGGIADFMGAKNIRIIYDREGWPMANIRGTVFPNTQVTIDMAFLRGNRMTEYGAVFSDRIVLPRYERYGLTKLIPADSGITLDETGVYKENARAADIAPQLHRFPDLQEALTEPLQDERFIDLVEGVERAVSDWGENWGVHVDIPLSPAAKQITDSYGAFRVLGNVDSHVDTLNEVLEQIKALAPKVEATYADAFVYASSL